MGSYAPDIPEALARPEAYPHATTPIQIVETHISWVFLTGRYAYKVKKPVDFGFLDFSTLKQRAHFCREEVRLNRRLCPELYLGVVPITHRNGTVCVGGKGVVTEYAVKMQQFSQSEELDRLLAVNRLDETHIDRIAETVATFHKSIPAAEYDSEYGLPEKLLCPLRENFRHIANLLHTSAEQGVLKKLETWTMLEYRRLKAGFLARKAGGFVRHCHGDMHTGNMVWHKGRVMIFDCIEFNPSLFTIDVANDIAFLFMDLEHGGHPGLAWRFLNGYLQQTGDYDSIGFLRFYSLYRAMVRAKVTAIRHRQGDSDKERHATLEEHLSYLRQAFRYTAKGKPHLMITTGLSGSGKSTIAMTLSSLLQAVHLRSDIERKRLYGMEALERSQNRNPDLYTSSATEETYRKLEGIAGYTLEEGFPVIADATFLEKSRRDRFRELAASKGCPFTILRVHARKTTLYERVRKRFRENRDPSEADETILCGQRSRAEHLSGEELRYTIDIDSELEIDLKNLARKLRRRATSPLCIPCTRKKALPTSKTQRSPLAGESGNKANAISDGRTEQNHQQRESDHR